MRGFIKFHFFKNIDEGAEIALSKILSFANWSLSGIKSTKTIDSLLTTSF
jgi:hypothetical protein